MKILEQFDAAIALSEKLEHGYQIDGRTFSAYLSNKEWENWLWEMSEVHRKQFDSGSGGELESKNGRPPKMASFASSSRMIYALSKDIPGFQFEKQLPTKIGGIANLDGFLERENELIYIEAKCREPYSHMAVQAIKKNYKPLYCYLREKMSRTFSCVMEDIPDSREMRVAFFCKGRPVRYFDIKQIICHMLSVANEMLTSNEEKSILFLYLLFNPSNLELPDQSAEEIFRIYEDTCYAANTFGFPEMFGHIVDYLIREYGFTMEEEKLDRLKNSFRFILTDQITYKTYIGK